MPSTTYEPDQYVPHLGTTTVRPICTGERDLILADSFRGPDAWIGMPDAPVLREWR